jgi:hypothetical protein
MFDSRNLFSGKRKYLCGLILLSFISVICAAAVPSGFSLKVTLNCRNIIGETPTFNTLILKSRSTTGVVVK